MTSACVSPRWKMAEPCVRGSTPTSQVIGADLLGTAAVDALAFEDQVADDALFQGLEGGRHLRRRVFRFAVLRADIPRRCAPRSSLMLVGAARPCRRSA